MAGELRASVINMKSLSQDIKDPIVVGSGDSNGRTLEIIFTQEAAARLTPGTNVYLSWRHIGKNVKGYNIFSKREDTEVPIWYIHYPKEMLHEGDVLANIDLVDDISVSSSVTFTIHVLAEAWDGVDWTEEDDLSEFKKALIKVQEMTDDYDVLKQMLEDYMNADDVITDLTGGDEQNG